MDLPQGDKTWADALASVARILSSRVMPTPPTALTGGRIPLPQGTAADQDWLTKGMDFLGGLVGTKDAMMQHGQLPPDVNENAVLAGQAVAAALPLAGVKAARNLAKAAQVEKAANEAQGIRAFHGSPHSFEKFDMSRIGTGEGAQAFGHGLYFAENEDVAKSYRPDRSYVGRIMSGVESGVNWDNPIEIATRAVDEHGSNAVEFLSKVIAQSPKHPAQSEANKTVQQAIQLIKNGEVSPKGSMYEVRINASPDELLDWDKPLSQQPEKVRQALATIDPDLYHPSGAEYDAMEPGQTTYLRLADANVPSAEVAPTGKEARQIAKQRSGEALRQAGIKGIKYLDAGSRSSGEGSRNYVIFDDKLIDILRKYGLLPPIAAGAVANYAQRMQSAKKGGS